MVHDKGQQIRQRIVAAANRLFYEHGYRQTSFSDIAAKADVPRGNFYYYFKSKDELLVAVIDDRLKSISDMLEDWDRTIPAPRARLQRYLQIPLNEAGDVIRYGCPMGTLNMELIKDRASLQARAEKMFDLFLAWLEKQFAALGKAGESRMLALQLLGEAQGAVLMASVYKDSDFLKREVQRLKLWLDEL